MYRVKLKHKFIIVVHTGERNVAAGTALVVVVVASVHATHRRPTETVKTFQSVYVHCKRNKNIGHKMEKQK